MAWISFRQEGIEPLLHGELVSVTLYQAEVTCKNGITRHPFFRDVKTVYFSKEDCYQDIDNSWERVWIELDSYMIYAFFKELIQLESLHSKISNFPRDSMNDTGISLAETLVEDTIITHIKTQTVLQYVSKEVNENIALVVTVEDDLTKYFHEGDYVEGTERYGLCLQRMRGTVSKVYSDRLYICCDDWYHGYRGNSVRLYDGQGIIKFNKPTPNWWVGEKLVIDNTSIWNPTMPNEMLQRRIHEQQLENLPPYWRHLWDG